MLSHWPRAARGNVTLWLGGWASEARALLSIERFSSPWQKHCSVFDLPQGPVRLKCRLISQAWVGHGCWNTRNLQLFSQVGLWQETLIIIRPCEVHRGIHYNGFVCESITWEQVSEEEAWLTFTEQLILDSDGGSPGGGLRGGCYNSLS